MIRLELEGLFAFDWGVGCEKGKDKWKTKQTKKIRTTKNP